MQEGSKLKNKELRSIIIKVIVFQLLMGTVVVVIVNNYINKTNSSIVKQNQVLVGNLLNNHPQLEDEIIPYITKEISEDNVKLGEQILRKYGYTTEINKSLQPVLKGISPSVQTTILILIILSTLILVLIIISEYNKIYGKIRKVYKAAEKFVEGDFDVHLKDEGEGEFNILNHQFNQMANRLENSLEILKNEKVFLKNTISDISHQLKTPLSSLVVLNDLMLEDEQMDMKVRNTFLEKSKVQIERMEWLIINLLKVARIEAGAIQFKREKVYLKDIALLALEALSPKFNIENISFEVLKDLSVQSTVEPVRPIARPVQPIAGNGGFYGDKEWTTEALINILKNSIEHSNNKNIKIKIEETPLFSSITVKDYGQGIDAKDIPHIFQRFYKVDSEVKPDSIGIGLNLAKLIVESQEGTISVKSKKGKGTSFTVSFLK